MHVNGPVSSVGRVLALTARGPGHVEHVYKVSIEHVERFLSYEVRLKFSDDTDANGITIPLFGSSKDRRANNVENLF